MGQSGSVAGLSPEEKRLLQESWAVICTNKKQLAIDLFTEYFSQWPEDQKFFRSFANVPITELGKNPKFVAHAMTVIFSLSSIIDQVDSEDVVEAMFTKQVTNHTRRNVVLQHYKNLESVISRNFEKHLTKEQTNAWLHGFDIFNSMAENTLQSLA